MFKEFIDDTTALGSVVKSATVGPVLGGIALLNLPFQIFFGAPPIFERVDQASSTTGVSGRVNGSMDDLTRAFGGPALTAKQAFMVSEQDVDFGFPKVEEGKPRGIGKQITSFADAVVNPLAKVKNFWDTH